MPDYDKMKKDELIKIIMALRRELDIDKNEAVRLIHDLQVHQVELEAQNRELIEARAEIEAARDRYADLYDHAPAGYFTLDAKGRILEMNLTAAAMLGRERSFTTGMPLVDFLFRADVNAFFRHLGECVKNGKSAADLRIQKGTEAVYAHVESAAYKGPVDAMTTIRTVLIDISMRKKAEDLTIELAREQAALAVSEGARIRIAESEALYKAVGETIPYGVWLAGPDGGMEYLSKSFLELTGNTMESCAGIGWLDCLLAEDIDRVRREWDRCISEGRYCEIEFRLKGTDGSIHDILCRGIPIRNERGKIERWAGVNIDITRMKKAEQELFDEKERLSVTLTSIGECVITADSEDRIVYMNREAERLTGWKLAEAVGRKAGEMLEINELSGRRRITSTVEAFAGPEKSPFLYGNIEMVNRFGVARLIAGTLGPLRNGRGEIIGNVIVFRDITGVKRMEEELLKARKLESVGALASGIARDFISLLTSIKGNIEFAMEEPPKESIKRLEEAETVIEMAKSLANQLVTFAQGLKPVKEAAYIDDILKSALSGVCETAGIECRTGVDAGTWIVEVDSDQVREALRNIIVNAGEAVSGGGMIEVRSSNMEIGEGEMPPLAKGAYVWITIKDTGKGIPEQDLPRVFDPFFTNKPGKSGMGLTIAYSIIRNHGGHIAIDSKPGQGTVVNVFLPALKTKKRAAA